MAAAAIYDFSGKHAVITGGAAGIGEACARRLLAGGAKVSIWDRDAKALAAVRDKFGAHAQGVQVDVSDEQSVIAAVKATLSFSPRSIFS